LEWPIDEEATCDCLLSSLLEDEELLSIIITSISSLRAVEAAIDSGGGTTLLSWAFSLSKVRDEGMLAGSPVPMAGFVFSLTGMKESVLGFSTTVGLVWLWSFFFWTGSRSYSFSLLVLLDILMTFLLEGAALELLSLASSSGY